MVDLIAAVFVALFGIQDAEPYEPDETVAYQDVECFVSCMSVCLWPFDPTGM